MTRFKTLATAGVLALAAPTIMPSVASAGTYGFAVMTGWTNGAGFDTVPNVQNFIGSVAMATFTYTGALSFNSLANQNFDTSGDLNTTFFGSSGAYTITNFNGSGTVTNYASIDFGGDAAGHASKNAANFLASSGSAGNLQYGSFYAIDLGVLSAGTVLGITHDDGASVYQNGVRIGQTVSGPTAQVTDTVRLASAADTILYYSRQNGTPSMLDVAVPEPMSLSLFGVGIAGLVGIALTRAGLARRQASG